MSIVANEDCVYLLCSTKKRFLIIEVSDIKYCKTWIDVKFDIG